jgi:hypothetical protein
MTHPQGGLLKDARVYLSGPMDFVASRAEEAKNGWRNRVGQFLKSLGVTVFDPWQKPEVRGLYEYGREGPATSEPRKMWTFEQGKSGADRRSKCAEAFWPALHIDLRMVDTSDFVIAYCPTNVYSVGTPHEIVLARMQRKPVLFVSPQVRFGSLERLQRHLAEKNDAEGLKHLGELKNEVPIKENPNGAPSLWYMPLIGGEHFFDGFGFEPFRDRFDWRQVTPLEAREQKMELQNPLLPFLQKLDRELPKKWSRHTNDFVDNDDWLLWDIHRSGGAGGATVDHAKFGPHEPGFWPDDDHEQGHDNPAGGPA